jgi:hypothetical protein
MSLQVLTKGSGTSHSGPGVDSKGEYRKRLSPPTDDGYTRRDVQGLPQPDGDDAGVEKRQRKPGELFASPRSLARKPRQDPVGDPESELRHPAN